MRLIDNTVYGKNASRQIVREGEDSFDDLQRIANIKLNELEECPNLLLFPREWNAFNDGVFGSEIISLSHDNETLETGNIMGFIGLNKTNLSIASRFAEHDEDDLFLHYMLQKVMGINVLNLQRTGDRNAIWDFLVFFFPYFLNKALSQGLYKEYKHNEYNDANVRGVIDVKRHLRINIPFAGKVAYSTREYNYDNPVMQLIRHTIEYIKTHRYNNVLTNNADVFTNINKIILATPAYDKNSRPKLINLNKRKPVVHPYFTEYKALQRLCIRILTNDKISTNNEKEKIHGILFDGAWLWEEYLNTILKDKGFKHPKNKTGEDAFHLFYEEGRKAGRIYPDFYKETPSIIADAKYKRLVYDQKDENDIRKGDKSRKSNSDYYQIISYMYRFESKTGYLIFPYSSSKNLKKYILRGFEDKTDNSKVILLGMKIPNSSEIESCEDAHLKVEAFKSLMKASEVELKEKINVE